MFKNPNDKKPEHLSDSFDFIGELLEEDPLIEAELTLLVLSGGDAFAHGTFGDWDEELTEEDEAIIDDIIDKWFELWENRKGK